MVCGAGGFAACRDRLYLLGPREGGDEEWTKNRCQTQKTDGETYIRLVAMDVMEIVGCEGWVVDYHARHSSHNMVDTIPTCNNT